MEHACTKRIVLVVLTVLILIAVHSTSGHSSIHRTLHSKCSRCPPGFGVLHKCTATADTICRSCQTGYFSSKHSRTHACTPCSSCGEGFIEIEPCVSTRNTVCSPCAGEKTSVSTCQTNVKTAETDMGEPAYQSFIGIDEEVVQGMSHLASFQIALVLAVVTALLATTLRLRVCTSSITELQERRKSTQDVDDVDVTTSLTAAESD